MTVGNGQGLKDGFRTDIHAKAMDLVFTERLRQYQKFGNQRLDLKNGYVVLAEEMGEVARAILEGGDCPEYLEEMVQVAAVAVQLVEDYIERLTATPSINESLNGGVQPPRDSIVVGTTLVTNYPS